MVVGGAGVAGVKVNVSYTHASSTELAIKSWLYTAEHVCTLWVHLCNVRPAILLRFTCSYLFGPKL